MKKTLLFLLLIYSVGVRAQELTLPSSLMNKDSCLRHSYTIYSPGLETFTAHLAKAMERLLVDKKRAIDYRPDLDTALVDVVFHFDGKKLRYRDRRVKGGGGSISRYAKSGVRLLERMFYSGTRPSYSTVFTGDDGTYAEYRIPSVLVLPSGRIVAFIEARQWHKDQAENDIVARYSDDMGKTWSDLIVVDQQGAASLNNICVIHIDERSEILVMYQCFPPKLSEGSSFATGEQLKTLIVTSKDGGETWGTSRDISAQVTYPGTKTMCSGPGIAIRATDGPDKGRILVPFNANGNGGWFNYVAFSDDLGDSWKITKGHSGYGANESQIVQTGPTEFLINARSHRFPEANTYETPAGWNPWNFTRVTRNRVNTRMTLAGDKDTWAPTEVQLNLPDPTCQGSVLRLSGLGIGKKKEKSRILLSNPASQYTVPDTRPYANTPPCRMNGTVKLSYDEGKTWTYAQRIYGNRFTEYQYSVLVDLGKGRVGCFFETYPSVRFAVFDVTWLTGGEDAGPDK